MKFNVKTIVAVCMILATPWLWNAYKFSKCDFEGNYKCELIHGAGIIIPPAAYVTVWFDVDGGDDVSK